VRLVVAHHVEGPVAVLDELVKCSYAFAVVLDLCERERGILDAGQLSWLLDVDDPVGVLVGKRSEEHSIDDAEDGRVQPDPQPEGEYECRCVPRRP
jgi:hypothetical protein